MKFEETDLTGTIQDWYDETNIGSIEQKSRKEFQQKLHKLMFKHKVTKIDIALVPNKF